MSIIAYATSPHQVHKNLSQSGGRISVPVCDRVCILWPSLGEVAINTGCNLHWSYGSDIVYFCLIGPVGVETIYDLAWSELACIQPGTGSLSDVT